ncbi:MAG: pilin [Elusimicrobia bacterium]|nr:pilin [Elusimicrobiota bacterium]
MKKQKGFTLTELVIVISLVAILSAISVPIYKDYVSSAYLAEGYTLLSQIRDAQLSYYNDYGMFLKGRLSNSGGSHYTCYDTVLGINGRLNKHYTYFSVGYDGYAPKKTDKYQFYAEVQAEKKKKLGLVYNLTDSAEVIL